MPNYRSLFGIALLITAVAMPGCVTRERAPSPEVRPEFHSPRIGHYPSAVDFQRMACEQSIRETLESPPEPGAPLVEANRIALLTETKAEPVVWSSVPQHDDTEVSALVQRYREQLATTDYPVDVLKRLLPIFQGGPKVGRETLLKQGYLYADDPKLARALVDHVRADHLFGHERIWIRRGESVAFAERRKNRYYYVDGPNAGDQVSLLLFDQLGYDEVPELSLVRDFRSLRARLHFDRARVRHITKDRLVVDLLYGKAWVPSLLKSKGARLELECDVLGTSLRQVVEVNREHNKTRAEVVSRLQRIMLQQIDEQLPFDEPRREWGHQLDGRLRQNWRHAYLNGRRSFAFNGDRYRVFDNQGRPLVPQVCVDFLTDTFERASGTWWRRQGEPIGRDVGKLDYDPRNIVARSELRRVPQFVAHARNRPGQFEILDVPTSERIPMGDVERFFQYLQHSQGDYQPGDIVVIRGRTPWDRAQQHYHSFFIYENDPLSGIPIALVGNAGRPSVRYWMVEARRTPERTIWHRIRPTTAWLQSIAAPEVEPAPIPVPLSPRGNKG